jgi:transcription elongation factor Elf1
MSEIKIESIKYNAIESFYTCPWCKGEQKIIIPNDEKCKYNMFIFTCLICGNRFLYNTKSKDTCKV